MSHTKPETLQRLGSKLRSMFPGLSVQSSAPRELTLKFPVSGSPEIEIRVSEVNAIMYSIETSLILRPRTLAKVRETDFLRLLADENSGLRGVTVLSDGSATSRALKLKASFVSAQDRETDEIENVGIDVLSLVRFAQILEERVSLSSAAGLFCYQTYRLKYSMKKRSGNRHINFARHVFRGSAERIFAQITATLKEKHGYSLRQNSKMNASATASGYELLVRVPEETPILTCYLPLELTTHKDVRLYRTLSELNLQVPHGHFELSADQQQVSFSTWKHLTNELHQDTVAQFVATMKNAELVLRSDRYFARHESPAKAQAIPVTFKRAA